MRSTQPTLILLCGMLSVVACESGRDPAFSQAWDIESAPLVYTGRRGATNRVFVQDGPSAPPRRRIDAAAARNQARFSPDGARIAYQVREGGAVNIHVVDADGSNDQNLTAHPAFDVLPRWSPDGTRIAFMSTRGFEVGGDLGPFPGRVYVVGADGTGFRQVTTEPLTSSLGPGDWSPDGRTLLVSRNASGIDIFALDVATGSETRLTSDTADEYGASYSPDGARIAFHAVRPPRHPPAGPARDADGGHRGVRERWDLAAPPSSDADNAGSCQTRIGGDSTAALTATNLPF